VDRPARTFVLPAPLVPDGRTIRHSPKDHDADSGADIFIPVANAIESSNAKIRRAVRTRGHIPNDDAATKLLYLVLNHTARSWKRPPREWIEAKTQFAIIFSERFVNV